MLGARTAVGLVATTLAVTLLSAPPASAACHVVAFVTTQVSAAESGSVTLSVELRGRQSTCGGTVDWATSPGTASAGADYVTSAGTLTFAPGNNNDRVQQVQVPVIEDNTDEPDETFTVALSNAQGSFSVATDGGGTATVTIVDDDEPAPAPTPTASPSQTPSPIPILTPAPTPTPTATATPSPTASATPSATPTPAATASEAVSDEPSAEPSLEASPTESLPPPVATPSTGVDNESVTLDEAKQSSGGGFPWVVVVLLLLVASAVGGTLAVRHQS